MIPLAASPTKYPLSASHVRSAALLVELMTPGGETVPPVPAVPVALPAPVGKPWSVTPRLPSCLQTPSVTQLALYLGWVSDDATVKIRSVPTLSCGTASTGMTHENLVASPP